MYELWDWVSEQALVPLGCPVLFLYNSNRLSVEKKLVGHNLNGLRVSLSLFLDLLRV
ncbi:hypothetical protein [Desulforamulus reducens]|uniref:hypothetical protein n=1 Tax=Desulforamulus reducens TaxID=59610 RepID=UPI0018DD9972|nr:hypothetical protein [Desulforamulus reducens]